MNEQLDYEYHGTRMNAAIILCTAANITQDAAELELRTARERNRPFHLLKPKVYPDGNMWCCLYGDNLQEGVAGFGETPELASINFDLNWLNQTMAKGKDGGR